MIGADPQATVAAPSTADDSGTVVESYAGPLAAERLGIPWRELLHELAPRPEFLERIPIGFARQHRVLGLAGGEGTLTLALVDLRDWPIADVVARLLRTPVEPLLTSETALQTALNTAYAARTGQAQAVIASLDEREHVTEIQEPDPREDLLDVAGRAPVIKLVNMILFEAIKGRASDIHVQPYEDELVIRLRIDGVLYDAFRLPKDLQDEVTSRVKVIGRMNIAEKRLPQDGRATVQLGSRMIDLRIASLPTSFGERVVIRLLDKSARIYTLAELGMEARTMTRFRELIGLEHGLILVTGPTGGGKSTTLYAALSEINAKDRNIVTLEDPIEYQLEGISQTQVSEKKGMTFASGLRSVLRQDPDIIMVGEIRDQETAVMAIQSALTGHLVFSTLHTNDAASAITRLLDLGIEHYLVASSVVAVLAQRLVRRICPACRQPAEWAPAQFARLGVAADQLPEGSVSQGAGCEKCRQTGFHGRLGIFELLVVDDAVRDQVQRQANASKIRQVAIERGMRLLRDDGIAKVFDGQTTLGEVLRVTMRAAL
jgi:general secretion pathway protein E